LDHERIETTEAKAKEIRGFAERMITLGKEGTLPARRRALGFLRSKAVVTKLFSDVAGRFKDRPGGYTRIVKTRRRIGDGGEMVAIELVSRPEVSIPKKSAEPFNCVFSSAVKLGRRDSFKPAAALFRAIVSIIIDG